jgi:hypothetical protein
MTTRALLRWRIDQPVRNALLSTVSTVSLLALAGCSSSAKEPAVASAGGHAAYAVRYDEELTAATKSFSDAQSKEKTLTGGFAAYVDQLKKPDWSKVELIVSDSDEAGKSADFAEAANDQTAIKNFWDAEKGEITGRAMGSPQVKESGCGGEQASGQIAFAMNEAVNKRLQKRLRARNDAFVVIERYRTPLGPQNVQPLEKLADDVSEASYDVHVLMLLQRKRLEALVKDQGDVKKTLDRYVQEENALQAEPGRTDADKKASQDRVTAANKKKGEIDNVAAQAQAQIKDMDKSIDAATKDYDDQLKALKAKVDDRKKADAAGGAKS